MIYARLGTTLQHYYSLAAMSSLQCRQLFGMSACFCRHSRKQPHQTQMTIHLFEYLHHKLECGEHVDHWCHRYHVHTIHASCSSAAKFNTLFGYKELNMCVFPKNASITLVNHNKTYFPCDLHEQPALYIKVRKTTMPDHAERMGVRLRMPRMPGLWEGMARALLGSEKPSVKIRECQYKPNEINARAA